MLRGKVTKSLRNVLPDHMKYNTPHVSWANDLNSRTIPFVMMEISLFAGCLDDLFCINSHEVKTKLRQMSASEAVFYKVADTGESKLAVPRAIP